MKSLIGTLAVIGMAAVATPAAATQLNITVTGVLVSQGNQSGIHNTGVDANLSVGSTIILTASFDTSREIAWGDTGYSIVGMYGLPDTGNSFFRIDGPGVHWQAADEFDDGGLPFYAAPPPLGTQLPAIILQGDKVVGLAGPLQPSSAQNRAPGLDLGSRVPFAYDGNFPVPVLANFFGIGAPNGEYGNTYNTPGFGGVWDFANSTVIDPPSPDAILAAVPEPATWAMLLAGFGMVGFALRRRQRATFC